MKVSDLSCEICGNKTGPFYRANPKGELARWRCEECLATQPETGLKEIVDVIAGKKTPPPPRAGREERMSTPTELERVLSALDRLSQFGHPVPEAEDAARLLREMDTQRLAWHRRAYDLAKAWYDMIEENGVDHDDPDCPQDDTCNCENIARITAAFGRDGLGMGTRP